MRRLRRAASVATSLPGRIAISAGLLAIVAATIDWSAFGERLSDAKWGWFFLASGLVFAGLLVAAVRWHLLVVRSQLPVRLRVTLRAYGVGAFANNVLPTGFGGDAVRAWLVGRSGKPLARALTSVVADRASAFVCLVLLGWIGLAVAPDSVPGELVALLGLASALAVVASVAAVVVLRRRGLGRVLPASLRPWAREVAGVLRAYGRSGELGVRVLVLGLLFQAIMIAALWSLSESLGLSIEPTVLAVVMPLVLLATLAPISIAGFGVREGAFVALLTEVGVSSSDAVLLSLLSVPAIVIGSAPGGLALLLRPEPLESAHEVLEHVHPTEDLPAPADASASARVPASAETAPPR